MQKIPHIGVLALQGAFIEHENMLMRLGARCHEIRQLTDLDKPLDGLVLPGGESTVQKKLLHDLGLFEPLQAKIRQNLPVLATCAGLILLADETEGRDTDGLQTLPVCIKRNAYGRQLGSFATSGIIKGLPDESVPFSMRFIRAPYISKVLNPKVNILATVDKHIVAVSYQKQLALAFHPELGDDLRIHQAFLNMID